MIRTVSVLIPTYNRPAALAELLEALYRQTYRPSQIVIVNDAGEPVDAVVALYPELPVTLINHTRNMGHVHARNTALRFATGDWMMLCDDDDLPVPTHIERMLRAADNADLVYSDVEIVDFAWNAERTMRLPRSRRLFAYRYDLAGMRRFSTFVSSGCLYRRAIHETLGEFDIRMFHYWDWDFILRVAEHGFTIERVPVASALYAFAAESGDNMSGNPDEMRKHLDRLCEKHRLGRLPTKNFFLLLEEPEVKEREAASEIVWDGNAIQSRYVL